jgi:hypothetical protein
MQAGRLEGENTFASALATDRVVAMLVDPQAQRAAAAAEPVRRGFWSRVFG